MLISNILKSIIVMHSIDTRFYRNVFEAVQNNSITRHFLSIPSKKYILNDFKPKNIDTYISNVAVVQLVTSSPKTALVISGH